MSRTMHFVCGVLTLDAFARCWVQEVALLRAVAAALPESKRPACSRLERAWQARRMEAFEASMARLAEQLARAACDRETLADDGIGTTLREVGKAIGFGGDGPTGPKARAMKVLAERLDAETLRSTDQLIEIHELGGRAAAEVLARLAGDFAVDERVSEGKAAMLGGIVSGALSGLAADLASGGLTFGAGLLTGGLLGALGAAGLAKGYNVMRGADETTVRWSDAFLDGLFASALLRYLAVAHYGRGRGDWKRSEYPPFWKEEVTTVVEAHRATLAAIWSERAGNVRPRADGRGAYGGTACRGAGALRTPLSGCLGRGDGSRGRAGRSRHLRRTRSEPARRRAHPTAARRSGHGCLPRAPHAKVSTSSGACDAERFRRGTIEHPA